MAQDQRQGLDPLVTQRLLDLAPVMARTLDGRILLWTDGMRQLYGYTPRQALGAVSHALLATQFPRPLPQIDAELVRQGRWTGELIQRRRDGERIVAVSHWALHRGDKETPAMVMEFNHDLTAEKTSETDRQRLAAIVENSQDAIIGKTLDGIVTSWNPAAEEIFGYTAAEMVGQPMAVLFPPDLLNEEASILARLRDGVRVEPYETTRLRKDGKPIRIALTVSPVRDASGQVVGASKIARDISAQVSMRERLKDAETELLHVSRLSEMGQMASTLAHELNQPLSAIANYLQGGRRLLARAKVDSARLAEALDKAAAQALRAGEVIRRLRAFVTRGESEREVESLSALVEEASALALIGAKEQGVRATFNFDPRADGVVADRVQVQQVTLNLIRNAVEAMADGSRRELVITTDVAGGFARVSVADTGSGLSPEVAARLFEPFVSTKASGMGVGLSISRTIVEAHGGRIWCDANRDGGATFRFTLQRAGKEAARHAG